MSYDVVVTGVGFFLTFVTYIVYVTSRFAKLESEVKHLRDDIEDFHEIKQMVYKIHAQNELLLNLRATSVSFN